MGPGRISAGLGLRNSARHAPGAYLASRTATHAKCLELDPNYVWDAANPDASVSQALTLLNHHLGPSRATLGELDGLKQKEVSKRLDESELTAQLASQLSASQLASLRSELLPGASGFLSATPSIALGLSMEPAEFVVSIKTRLHMRQYPHARFCPCCDAVLDAFGCHADTCMAAGDHLACHNVARNLVGRIACNAGLAPTLEKAELLPPPPDDPSSTNHRRPADVFLPSFDFGAPAALDLAIISPQRQDVLTQAVLASGAAAVQYEQRKRNFLDTETQCSQQGVLFIPMVAESSGGWGPSGRSTLRKLAKAAGQRCARDEETSLSQILERLSVAVRAAKARAVLRRAGGVDDLAGDPIDAAATALAATSAA